MKSLKNLPHPFQFLQVLTSRDEPYYMKQSSWNPNVHGSAHNSPLLVSTRSQMNPVHAFPSSNVILWSALDLPYGLFPSVYPISTLFRHWSMAHQSHSPWLDHSNYIWQAIKTTQPLIIQSSHALCYFFPHTSKQFLSLDSKALSIHSSLNLRAKFQIS